MVNLHPFMPKIIHKLLFVLIVKILLASEVEAQTVKDTIIISPCVRNIFLDKKMINIKPDLHVISQDFYSNKLPFFCEKELQIEKLTKVPLRFRLGSIDYCNKLEGKLF